MVSGSLGVGGAEAMALQACRTLISEGVHCDFLVFGDEVGALEDRALAAGARVLRMAPPAPHRPREFERNLARLLVTEGPYDVVHSHVNHASASVLRGAHAAGVRVRVAHGHSTRDDEPGLLRLVYLAVARRVLARKATHWVACGDEAGRFTFGRDWASRGEVVPNGVDVERFQTPRLNREELRKEWGVTSGAPVWGAVARLVGFKNHEFMLRMLEADRARGGQATLIIAGDGPLADALHESAERKGITDRVRFLGTRRDVPEILAALDLVVMPSFHEGLPVSLVEAQASGTPTLLSDAVTAEADLGLGLVQFLPLDDMDAWLEAAARHREPADLAEVSEQMSARGYDAKFAGKRLHQIYRGVR